MIFQKAAAGGAFDIASYIQRGATLRNFRPLHSTQYTGSGTAVALPVDRIRAVPFPIGVTATLDRLGIRVTALAAGSSARVAIYRATSLREIYPAGLVIDSGAIDTTTNGSKEVTVNVTLTPGLYWAAYTCGVLAPTVTGLNGFVNPIMGLSAVPDFSTNFNSLDIAAAFAPFPDPFPGAAAWSNSSGPIVFGRFSA